MNKNILYLLSFALIINLVILIKGCIIENANIELEKAKIEQQQETERTEERSQFWQKLILYGNDENERN